MKLIDIQEQWKIDAKIDRYKITEESLKCPILHAFYYEIYMVEKRLLNEHIEKYKNFELAKNYYYMGKMDKDELTRRKWQQFDIHLLKGDIPKVVESDNEIIDYKLKIAEQADKVEFLKSILQSINQRSYLLRTALDNDKFQAGA